VHKDYWLTDGLYGSFNCILYDDQKPQPRVLRSPLLAPAAADGPTYESTLWGPTCDRWVGWGAREQGGWGGGAVRCCCVAQEGTGGCF
jgi:hypothetical protein